MDEEGQDAWHEIVRDVLKRHEVKLVAYVPDNVLRPLIDAVHADRSSPRSPARGRRRRWASSRAPGWAGCAASC